MTIRPSVGISIDAIAFRQVDDPLLTQIPPPTHTTILAGQRADTLADWGTFMNPENYGVRDGFYIQTITPQVNGAAIAQDYVFQESDLLTFQIMITDNLTPSTFLISYGTATNPPENVITVSNQSEFETAIALGAAALSGMIINITGSIPEASITDLAPQGPVTVQTSGDGVIYHMTLSGQVSNFAFDGVRFQVEGWPAVHGSCVQFKNGLFTDIAFRNSEFRHGYGPALIDANPAADYPEYRRIDHNITALETETVHPIVWDNTAISKGSIYVFNNGDADIYAAVDNNTPPTTRIDPGRSQVLSANPSTDTHVRIASSSGSQSVNARTEIGLARYQAQAFASFGGALIGGHFEISGCYFSDLTNGIKSIPRFGAGAVIVLWKNDMERIYMDTIAFSATNAAEIHVLDNLLSKPYSRSGIAQNLNGDPEDPHGDMIQTFGDNNSTVENLNIIGNISSVTDMRADVAHQGLFVSDNNQPVSYHNCFIVGNVVLNGNARGISLGDPNYEAEGIFIWGNDVLDATDLDGRSSGVLGYAASDEGILVVDTIAQNFSSQGTGEHQLINTLDLRDVNPAEIYPNFANLAAAKTRTQVLAAMTPAGAGIGKGAAAAAIAINRNAATYDQVFITANANPGLVWSSTSNVTPNALYTFPAKQMRIGGIGLAVTPNSGTQIQITSDGITAVRTWTSGAITIDQGQFIEMRVMAGNDAEMVSAGCTIGAYAVSADVTSGVTAAPQFRMNGATFADPANVPAGTEAIEWTAQVVFPTDTGGFGALFTQESSIVLEVSINSSRSQLRIYVEDGNSMTVIPGTALQDLEDAIVAEQLHNISMIVDYGLGNALVTVDNRSQLLTFTPTASATAQSNREIRFGGSTASTLLLDPDTVIQRLRVSLRPTAGTLVLHKELSVAAQGDLTGINQDPWIMGAVNSA